MILKNIQTDGTDKVEELRTGHMYGDTSAPKLPYFLITNIEALRTRSGKNYTLVEEIINMAEHNELQMIAIDEVHKNMSAKSAQRKLVLEIKKRIHNAIEWIPMTGTPIMNKPTDVFTPLKLVNGHFVKSFWQWSQQFCIFGGYGGHEIMAYKNIPFLKDMLQKNMLRRRKEDVLDLPPKIYFTEYVENTLTQQRLYSSIEDYMWEHQDSILESMNPLTEVHTLTVANNVILLSEPWTAADKTQAEDRCHRIPTNHCVNIYTLLSKGTIDEVVHKIVYNKEDISNFIVDGKLDLRKNPELFAKLLGRN